MMRMEKYVHTPVSCDCSLLSGGGSVVIVSLFVVALFLCEIIAKIVSEYDQETPQSQTADNPMAPRGRAAKQSRDTRKTN